MAAVLNECDGLLERYQKCTNIAKLEGTLTFLSNPTISKGKWRRWAAIKIVRRSEASGMVTFRKAEMIFSEKTQSTADYLLEGDYIAVGGICLLPSHQRRLDFPLNPRIMHIHVIAVELIRPGKHARPTAPIAPRNLDDEREDDADDSVVAAVAAPEPETKQEVTT